MITLCIFLLCTSQLLSVQAGVDDVCAALGLPMQHGGNGITNNVLTSEELGSFSLCPGPDIQSVKLCSSGLTCNADNICSGFPVDSGLACIQGDLTRSCSVGETCQNAIISNYSYCAPVGATIVNAPTDEKFLVTIVDVIGGACSQIGTSNDNWGYRKINTCGDGLLCDTVSSTCYKPAVNIKGSNRACNVNVFRDGTNEYRVCSNDQNLYCDGNNRCNDIRREINTFECDTSDTETPTGGLCPSDTLCDSTTETCKASKPAYARTLLIVSSLLNVAVFCAWSTYIYRVYFMIK